MGDLAKASSLLQCRHEPETPAGLHAFLCQFHAVSCLACKADQLVQGDTPHTAGMTMLPPPAS